MASSFTQVEAEVNKQAEETIKDLPVTGEKEATPTDDDEEAQVMVHEEEERLYEHEVEEERLYEDEGESEIKEENGESDITIDDEEAEPDHAPTLDEEVKIEEFNRLED